jgi:hypothetical protein
MCGEVKKGTLILKQFAAGWVANIPALGLDRIPSRRFTPQSAADGRSHVVVANSDHPSS